MTIKEKTLLILSDLNFHCPCEFPSSQIARTIKDLRNDGYEFWVNETKTIWAKNLFCKKCGMNKPHRKLISLDKKNEESTRVSFTSSLRKRILELYENKDAFLGSKDNLEIDHRITPERKKEEALPDDVSDEELKKRYMVLTRTNNQIKRERCKKCIRLGVRQQSITGINFFYSGSEKYEGKCEGCFWAYPEKWVESLNKVLKNNELYRK